MTALERELVAIAQRLVAALEMYVKTRALDALMIARNSFQEEQAMRILHGESAADKAAQ